MNHERTLLKVLVAAPSAQGIEHIKAILPPTQFRPVISAASAADVRRKYSNTSPDIVIIVSPLRDESGVQLALDLADDGSSEIMLLAGNEIFAQASFIGEKSGIFTIPTPCNKLILQQTLRIVGAEKLKMKALEQQNSKLQLKLDEIKIVDRAKLLLVEKLKMSETEAHRYIEKTAMNRCVKRSVIAEGIIKTYES